jgi:hypothetical protein
MDDIIYIMCLQTAVTFVKCAYISYSKNYTIIREVSCTTRRSQCPRGLRHRSAAARLLRSWVRIPPGAWKSVCCECCVLSG